MLCGAGRMRRCCLKAHTHTRTLFSLVSLAQCGTYIAHTFTAHFVISVSEQGRACSQANARGVIQMTRRQIDLKWQDSCCTSQLSSFLVSCMDLMYTPMTHCYSAWVLKLLGFMLHIFIKLVCFSILRADSQKLNPLQQSDGDFVCRKEQGDTVLLEIFTITIPERTDGMMSVTFQ